MPAGRPTKYKKEYCEAMVAYFDRAPQQTVYKRTYHSDGQLKSEEPVVLAQQLPTFQGFAHELGVHADTLLKWTKRHSDFLEAYLRAKNLQENIWLVNAMSGQYSAQFAQFFGKNCLGYRDRREAEPPAELSVRLSGEAGDWAQ